jgi:hypothetical protein
MFNCSWVDTRWQQYCTHLHTNSTQNTENGTYITRKKLGLFVFQNFVAGTERRAFLPWYDVIYVSVTSAFFLPNQVLHTDLQIPTIREEITRLSTNYKGKIEVHPNKLTTDLFEIHGQGRLSRYSPLDLPTIFN